MLTVPKQQEDLSITEVLLPPTSSQTSAISFWRAKFEICCHVNVVLVHSKGAGYMRYCISHAASKGWIQRKGNFHWSLSTLTMIKTRIVFDFSDLPSLFHNISWRQVLTATLETSHLKEEVSERFGAGMREISGSLEFFQSVSHYLPTWTIQQSYDKPHIHKQGMVGGGMLIILD